MEEKEESLDFLSRIVPPEILKVKPYIPGKPIEEVKRELGISRVIKLASNENSLGPAPKAIQAIYQYASKIHFYPDGGCYYLKKDSLLLYYYKRSMQDILYPCCYQK